MAQQIQPTALPGRREAMRAPTVAKLRKATESPTWPTGRPSGFAGAKASAVTIKPRVAAQIDHARRAAVGGFMSVGAFAWRLDTSTWERG
jgi:hypothetical protein